MIRFIYIKMSLFVGNISRSARTEDVEKDFKKYGYCRIKFKGSYAFIEFESEKDGEEAIKNLQNKMIGGRELNIEWSKKSGRYDSSKRKRKSTSPRRKDIKDQKCFKCGHRGHFSYDCRDGSSRRRSRRSRSDSRHRHRKRSTSK